jgi:hypothetical protein
MGIILISSVSLSPPYLINLLIHHPRTNSKKRLCALCVETDTKQGKRQKASTNKKFPYSMQQNPDQKDLIDGLVLGIY